MREIKFRAWSKITEKMSDWDYIQSVKNLHKLMSLNHIVLMQFTGLKDQNGKDIYEGDILKTESEKHMVVSWNKRLASFCLDREGWAFTHWFGESCEPEQTEVIGNVHQNPELLK